MAAALGVMVVINKSRRLLRWRNVRIHLNDVRGLGTFIELEAVAEPESDLTTEHENVHVLCEALWHHARASPCGRLQRRAAEGRRGVIPELET